MCKSIKKLRYPDQAATDDEIRQAALQFVRKVSGYRVPSRANQAVFDSAVAEIAGATRRLLEELGERDARPAGVRADGQAEEQIAIEGY